MAMTKQKIIIILSIVILLSGVGHFGLRGFARLIYQQRTCEWANIDNIEMHTDINIPDIIACNCEYTKYTNTKHSQFLVDKKKVNINQYIIKNNFRKLTSESNNILANFHTTQKDFRSPNLSETAVLYSKQSDQNDKWIALLDSSMGILWVYIEYRD